MISTSQQTTKSSKTLRGVNSGRTKKLRMKEKEETGTVKGRQNKEETYNKQPKKEKQRLTK
jgi:hypothetical protein